MTGMNVKAQNNAALLAGATAKEEVAPKIEYQDASIDVVIKDLADQAGINVTLDSKITDALYDQAGKPLKKVSIKWRDLTARQALVAVLDNYGYVAIVDPANPKVVRITVKDPNAQEPLVLKVVKVRHANVTNLATLVKATLSTRSQVQADVRSGSLIIAATESDFANVSNVLAKVDNAAPQILIEAKFMETAKNPKSIKGIDWSGTLEGQNLTFGNGLTTGSTITKAPGDAVTVAGAPLPSGAAGASTTITPKHSTATTLETLVGSGIGGLSLDTTRGFHPSTAFLNADGVKAVISFLNTDSDTDFIANPRAVTMDNQEAELSVIRNVPIFEEEQAPAMQGALPPSTVKPNYSLDVKGTILNEIGIKLVVKPRVVGTSDVLLDLKPEISSVEGTARVTLGGRVSESPIFRRQKLTTQATVPSGNTLVLGGLMSDETTKGYTKVPVLGDMPGVGLLFRKDSKTRSKRTLLIFVTPSLVTDGDFQPTTSTFLKTKPDDKPDIDWPAWDTGKPASKYHPLF
mgnify:CR=1 FL=1